MKSKSINSLKSYKYGDLTVPASLVSRFPNCLCRRFVFKFVVKKRPWLHPVSLADGNDGFLVRVDGAVFKEPTSGCFWQAGIALKLDDFGNTALPQEGVKRVHKSHLINDPPIITAFRHWLTESSSSGDNRGRQAKASLMQAALSLQSFLRTQEDKRAAYHHQMTDTKIMASTAIAASREVA